MQNPSDIPYPAFLMCPPFSLSTEVANNTFMEKLTPEERHIDHNKALRQFLDMYNVLSSTAMVYLLPSHDGLQDQTYVANLGLVLPHLDDKTVVLMNSKLPERQGETPVGQEFFTMMGYKPIVSPPFWAGEAELKYVRDNLYIGHYGPETTPSALAWFRDTFNMHVIPLQQNDPRYYHLDCFLFPLTREKIITCPKLIEPKALKVLEKYVEIIAVDQDMIDRDIACCVRARRLVFTDSNISELKVTDEDYAVERKMMDMFSNICAKNALEPMFFNTSEFYKSGAGLACQFMHLNYVDYMAGRDPSVQGLENTALPAGQRPMQ
jgi:N-dimethylarginine dimethylaminohydrolase